MFKPIFYPVSSQYLKRIDFSKSQRLGQGFYCLQLMLSKQSSFLVKNVEEKLRSTLIFWTILLSLFKNFAGRRAGQLYLQTLAIVYFSERYKTDNYENKSIFSILCFLHFSFLHLTVLKFSFKEGMKNKLWGHLETISFKTW